MSTLTTELLPGFAARRVANGWIRPLVEDDMHQIEHLLADGRPPLALMRRIFFESPWTDRNGFSSLAYERCDGQLVGVLGLMPRPMLFQERPICAVVAHQLIVEQSRAGARAAIELTRRFLAGTQDLSLAMWDDAGRRIWTSLGGSVTPLHSFSWTRLLRPSRYVFDLLKGKSPIIDSTLSLLGRRRRSAGLTDTLDAVTMLSCYSAFVNGRALKPQYDVTSLRWLLETLGEAVDRRNLFTVAVRTESGRPLGWYVYHLAPSNRAEVLQIGGKDEALRDVIDHLFDHARRRGAVSISGPMDARLVGALSDRHCAFHRPRNAWTLIHSHDPRISEAIHAGDAFLSRLESTRWPIV